MAAQEQGALHAPRDEAYETILAIFKGETPSGGLSAAIDADNIAAARAFLQNGADPNKPDLVTGLTPLFHAQGADATKLLLEWGARVDEPGANGETALMRAAFLGDARKANALLSAGANPNRPDFEGRSALAHAFRDEVARKFDLGDWEAKFEAAAALLREKATPRSIDRHGRPALTERMLSNAARNAPHLHRLLDTWLAPAAKRLAAAIEGAHDATDSQHKSDRASEAHAKAKHAAAVARADAAILVDALDRDGKLSIAATALCDKGDTPLSLSIAMGDRELAERMLASGASPDARDGRGRSLIHWAVEAETRRLAPPADARMDYGDERLENKEWLGLALAATLRPDATDTEESSALHIISRRLLIVPGRDGALAPMVERLVDAGVNPARPDVHGSSPLGQMLAAGADQSVERVLAAARRDPELAEEVARMTTREEFVKLDPARKSRIGEWHARAEEAQLARVAEESHQAAVAARGPAASDAPERAVRRGALRM